MKKGWVLVLLVSLGLNLGLGLRLLGDRGGPEGRGYSRLDRESRRTHGRWADQDTTARRKMFARRMDHIADRLELSAEQREVFRKVHMETGRILMQKRVLISEKRDLLHDLVTSDEVDQDRIRRAIGELGQEQAVLDSLVAETVLQEMAVLDPDQRARYLEMLSFEKDHRGGRRGRGASGPRRQ
jgi:Spy/CpxP family protein refolding chaperone